MSTSSALLSGRLDASVSPRNCHSFSPIATPSSSEMRSCRGSGCRAQGSGARGQGTGPRVQGPGVRAQGTGARGQGSGRRAQGLGFRVQLPLLLAHRHALQLRDALLPRFGVQGPGFMGRDSGPPTPDISADTERDRRWPAHPMDCLQPCWDVRPRRGLSRRQSPTPWLTCSLAMRRSCVDMPGWPALPDAAPPRAARPSPSSSPSSSPSTSCGCACPSASSISSS
jgi:hypothetical protein